MINLQSLKDHKLLTSIKDSKVFKSLKDSIPCEQLAQVAANVSGKLGKQLSNLSSKLMTFADVAQQTASADADAGAGAGADAGASTNATAESAAASTATAPPPPSPPPPPPPQCHATATEPHSQQEVGFTPDRRMLSTDGVYISHSGWMEYRAMSAAEIEAANLDRINLLRRLMPTSQENFDRYAQPLITAMIELCMMLPAAEYQHGAEVGGLVKHNLQVALNCIDTVKNCLLISPSVKEQVEQQMMQQKLQQVRAEREQAARKRRNARSPCASAGAGAGTNPSLSLSLSPSTSAWVNEFGYGDTLARKLETIENCRNDLALTGELWYCFDATGNDDKELIKKRYKQQHSLVLATNEQLHDNAYRLLTEREQKFCLCLAVMLLSFAHDLGKLMYDLEIMVDGGPLDKIHHYNPNLGTLAELIASTHSTRVYMRHIANRGLKHEQGGLALGIHLLSRYCPETYAFINQGFMFHQLTTDSEPLPKLVLQSDFFCAQADNFFSLRTSLSTGSLISNLALEALATRIIEGVLPNQNLSEFYFIPKTTLLVNSSRTLALLELLLNELHFGNLGATPLADGKLFTNYLRNSTITANTCRTKENSIFAYYRIVTTEDLVIVRGVELNINLDMAAAVIQRVRALKNDLYDHATTIPKAEPKTKTAPETDADPDPTAQAEPAATAAATAATAAAAAATATAPDLSTTTTAAPTTDDAATVATAAGDETGAVAGAVASADAKTAAGIDSRGSGGGSTSAATDTDDAVLSQALDTKVEISYLSTADQSFAQLELVALQQLYLQGPDFSTKYKEQIAAQFREANAAAKIEFDFAKMHLHFNIGVPKVREVIEHYGSNVPLKTLLPNIANFNTKVDNCFLPNRIVIHGGAMLNHLKHDGSLFDLEIDAYYEFNTADFKAFLKKWNIIRDHHNRAELSGTGKGPQRKPTMQSMASADKAEAEALAAAEAALAADGYTDEVADALIDDLLN